MHLQILLLRALITPDNRNFVHGMRDNESPRRNVSSYDRGIFQAVWQHIV